MFCGTDRHSYVFSHILFFPFLFLFSLGRSGCRAIKFSWRNEGVLINFSMQASLSHSPTLSSSLRFQFSVTDSGHLALACITITIYLSLLTQTYNVLW